MFQYVFKAGTKHEQVIETEAGPKQFAAFAAKTRESAQAAKRTPPAWASSPGECQLVKEFDPAPAAPTAE